MCSHCNQAPDADKEVIKCMKCNHSFHINCMHLPISEDVVKVISDNPSMWWFCLSCVSVKSSDTLSSNEMNENGTVQPEVILQSTLTSFKKEVLTLISETIDRKLK